MELSEAEFQSTFVAPMRDISETAEEIVDLWAYAEAIVDAKFPEAIGWEWHVKHIYQSGDDKYQHLLVPVPASNTYFVFVIDLHARSIVGHHLLDLGHLYGVEA